MKRVLSFLLCCLFFSFTTTLTFGQDKNESVTYLKGQVVQITRETKDTFKTIHQHVQVKLLEGKDKGKIIPLERVFPEKSRAAQKLNAGDQVIVASQGEGNAPYSIFDRYRSGNLLYITLGFIILVLIAAGRRGFGSLLGLGITMLVILFFIVPQILAGQNPLFISITGSLFIMVTTLYLAHGFSQRTTIAVASTFLSLLITGLLAVFFVQLLRLTGGGSEDAYMLQFGQQTINLQGLLLGGIILGALGVLDDITTTQAATIYALAETDRKLPLQTLLRKGFSVGKEHITSLVNTLVLAYAGASLPLFIFFVLNPLQQPTWVILNNEMIVEEVARTLAGSIGLILAVPITTLLAAFFSRYSVKIK